MPQSIAKIVVHVVFSSKERRPWLRDRTLCTELYAYMATVLKSNVDTYPIIINGVEDHIHALMILSRKFPIMAVIQEAKTETSKWLKQRSPKTSGFTWQRGYGAFSVSESNIGQVETYIKNQQQHHRTLSFKDEYRQLCKRHGIELNESYAWD